MPEAVPMNGRVRNLNVYGHVNKVSHLPYLELVRVRCKVRVWKGGIRMTITRHNSNLKKRYLKES